MFCKLDSFENLPSKVVYVKKNLQGWVSQDKCCLLFVFVKLLMFFPRKPLQWPRGRDVVIRQAHFRH
jgi:hypothetical protein